MARARIDERWGNIITSLVADNPNISARKVWKQLDIENLNRPDPIPTKHPSKRTVDERVNKLREPENKEQLEMHRRVYFPETFLNKEVPMESVPYVMELMRHFPYRGRPDGSTRPTIRQADWFYTLSMSAPSSPIHARTTMAIMLSMNDVAPEEQKSRWVNRMAEAWLWYEPWDKPEDFHANQEISPAKIRMDLYKQYVDSLPFDPPYLHQDTPSNEELREMGATLEQWNVFKIHQKEQETEKEKEKRNRKNA